MEALKMKMGLMNCKECEKFNIGIKFYDALSWNLDSPMQLIGFDKEDKSITIKEEYLMALIQSVNPGQPTRKLKLIRADGTR